MVNSNTVNSNFHFIRSFYETFPYHFPATLCSSAYACNEIHVNRTAHLHEIEFLCSCRNRRSIVHFASFVNILLVTSDHSLYREDIRRVFPTYQKDHIIRDFEYNWHWHAPFKISLSVLYSIVWIWGLTGNSFKHLHLFGFFHNSRLIRRIQQNKIYKKRDLTRDWTWIACLTVRHLNHYARMFSVLVWVCNWILFMHELILSSLSNSFNWTKISFWKKTRLSFLIVTDQLVWMKCSRILNFMTLHCSFNVQIHQYFLISA